MSSTCLVEDINDKRVGRLTKICSGGSPDVTTALKKEVHVYNSLFFYPFLLSPSKKLVHKYFGILCTLVKLYIIFHVKAF